MPKFQMTELVPSRPPITARLGAGTGSANHLSDDEVGKIVKLAADSRYDLAAAGDPIEGFINSVEPATQDDYTIGSVAQAERREVTADGLEATPGTGVVAVGDYVVAGTVVAKGTSIVFPAHAKVTKATIQPGITEVAAVGDVNDHLQLMKNLWRVVSLGSAGTGAVGTNIIIEREGSM